MPMVQNQDGSYVEFDKLSADAQEAYRKRTMTPEQYAAYRQKVQAGVDPNAKVKVLAKGADAINQYTGGGKTFREQLGDLANRLRNTTAPQLEGPTAQAQEGPNAVVQSRTLQMLLDAASGKVVTAAERQAAQSAQRAAASQGSLAASATQRGAPTGAAYRQAANQTAAIQSRAANEAAQLRAQQQAAAQSILAQASGQARQQDQSGSQFNVSQLNEAQRTNLEAKLRSLGITTPAQVQALIAAATSKDDPAMWERVLAGIANATPLLGSL